MQPEAEEIQQATQRWMRDMQRTLPDHKDFPTWKHKLGLFTDGDGVWRCGGRMSKSSLPPSAQNPILLDKDHHLTGVLHNGVRETLAELRSMYWVIWGRQVVKKLLRNCVICRRYEGVPCQGIPSPSLPDY